MTLLQRSNTTGSHHNKTPYLQNPIILASQAKFSFTGYTCLWSDFLASRHLLTASAFPSAQPYASFFKIISIFGKFLNNFLFWEICDNQDFGSVLLLSGFLIKSIYNGWLYLIFNWRNR